MVTAPAVTSEAFYRLVTDPSPSLLVTAVLGALIVLGFLSFKSRGSEKVLPGVPELKGIPILGAAPIYLKHGMPELLGRLIAMGPDGISYANVVDNILVSVHDPDMVKEVHSFPDDVASREGAEGKMSWSPFWTLRRLIGNSLFNYVGPEVSHQRNVFIREFNKDKANAEKVETIVRIAQTHADALTCDVDSADIPDIRYSADNSAIAFWGETLYGNPHRHASLPQTRPVGGKVLELSEHIITLAGNPWPSVWYSFQLFFMMVTPGEPTRSEAALRLKVGKVVEGNVTKLEEYERNNPEAPLKTICNLSVMSGGAKTGPLSKFASEFTNLNLFGGRHSIGLNVTWSLIELDKHPECLTKLMAEIHSVDTTDFTSVNSKMPYLDAIIMELNRLHPTVHATVRVVNKETRLTSSKRIPVVLKPGMLIYLSYFYLHTAEKFWGSNSMEFDPQRFVGGDWKESPFMSFGYGPRNCVGYKFAVLAAKVYLVTLLKTYKLDVRDHDHEMKLGTLLETQKPVAVKVTRRG
ncbi:hypothetical protein BAUCODRAFT_106297 [Baudoinia panamericana UAMH 10762]|uniref:Cytochrome P450 n=1 Tax=Baudoinia panamericana (strain UAMH 10762) TaxID=717646 RepID=M2NCX7_BAUPA|nr:uncharacterized protein BAUCODRAFT_106297 [Baudoinia panamericana UAMH 10762]EMC97044.1 hypothetical protein BAUCODRAFT_106297 [Baudoinia panamericana UAMH 10762]